MTRLSPSLPQNKKGFAIHTAHLLPNSTEGCDLGSDRDLQKHSGRKMQQGMNLEGNSVFVMGYHKWV